MSQTTFKTNPVALEELLKECGNGKLQLPDFQRSWVWDEDRIKGLLASVSLAFPVGALMTLEMKAGAADTFARRPIEGAHDAANRQIPDALLLDGQQRMTSLYQTCVRDEAVRTITPKQKQVHHWYYLDMAKALDNDVSRDEAIVGVPADRKIMKNFGRDVETDLTTPEREYEHSMFPANRIFNSLDWMLGFISYWNQKGDSSKLELFKSFKSAILDNFENYRIPVIALGHDTSHEAVCLVFEKVNTGGKALDAFELVTAMYAAQGYRLRDDWFGTADALDGGGIQKRFKTFGHFANQKYGLLEKVASTDFLQAIALTHSRDLQVKARAAGKSDNEIPPVRATKRSLLDLPLEAYLAHRDKVEEGFKTAAKMLRQLNIFRVADLPYQTQLVPLASILAEIGPKWENATVRAKLARWFWCGIFGELYGSAIESRFALDVQQAPPWLDGGDEPSTVKAGVFRADRLRDMRTRLSAAYKGVHALLMQEGARDFRSGQKFDQAVFFDATVDIHHIFPQAWCANPAQGIPAKVFDSIINKTPIAGTTNKMIGGAAPSKYLARIEQGNAKEQPIKSEVLDQHLRSHCIDPALLRTDMFTAFMADREKRLLALIATATGHAVVSVEAPLSEGEDVPDDIARDMEPTQAAEA